MELNTPKRIKTIVPYINSPPESDSSVISTWNWPENSSSPDSCENSPDIANQNNANNLFNENRENRRGRPRSEALATLMIEGSTSPSAIKCGFCNRVFPREKSLQAHLRIHTGERPYPCDYPGCGRAFTQSGQLKTHLRLHTGERPFICSVPTCLMRFTHANRHCSDHPYDQLKRCDNFTIQSIPEQNVEVIKWLDKYRIEREDRTPPTRKTPKRSKQLKDSNNENNFDNNNGENEFPVTPNNTFKSRKGLMMIELDMNVSCPGASPIAVKNKPNPKMIQWQEPLSQEEDSGDELDILPVRSTFNPKKRWLREACQDDLARPLEPISTNLNINNKINNNNNLYNTNNIINPNQTRPTVLMVASKDKTMPLSTLNDNNIKKNINCIETTTKTIISPTPTSSIIVENIRSNNYNVINNNYHYRPSPPLTPPSPPPPPPPPQQPPIIDENRKWLGALALMELATDDGHGNVTEIIRNNTNKLTTQKPSVIQSYAQL